MATLRDRYRDEIAPKLREELGLANVMEVPRITKITLNMGVGEAVGDKKVMENAVADMAGSRVRSPSSRWRASPWPDSRSAMAGRLAAR
jgi:ribosomal protein L5